MTQDEVKQIIRTVKNLKPGDLNRLEVKDVWEFSEILLIKLGLLERVKYTRMKQAWAGHGAYRKK